MTSRLVRLSLRCTLILLAFASPGLCSSHAAEPAGLLAAPTLFPVEGGLRAATSGSVWPDGFLPADLAAVRAGSRPRRLRRWPWQTGQEDEDMNFTGAGGWGHLPEAERDDFFWSGMPGRTNPVPDAAAASISRLTIPAPQPQNIESPGSNTAGSFFGGTASIAGTTALVGAPRNTSSDSAGAAYVFRSLGNNSTSAQTQQARLVASDGTNGDCFGISVSLDGTLGLVGASNATIGTNVSQGAAYVFRNLNTVSGTVTEGAKLNLLYGSPNDNFGSSVSLDGTLGLVGASNAEGYFSHTDGAAFLFRNLDTASGTVTESAKLAASDGAPGARFGCAVSLSSTFCLIGASGATVNGHSSQGEAYLFFPLDLTQYGQYEENVKLVASDGAANDNFGYAVSLSSYANQPNSRVFMGLVGAYTAGYSTTGTAYGAAYLYRNVAGYSGTMTESACLVALYPTGSEGFGSSVSLAGTTGLVGAFNAAIGNNAPQGAAYVFLNLDTATGRVTQDVKLFASDGRGGDNFGYAVSLDGDAFIIGARGANNQAGKSYSGTISSMTTLDTSGQATINGVSFISEGDWIIGQNTNHNQVTLSKGDTATVIEFGKGVYVGQNKGSSSNTLLVQGTVTTNAVTVSNAASASTSGNVLQIDNNGGNTTAGTLSAPSGGIVVNSGGTLLLSGSSTVTNRIGRTTPLTLKGGGKFSTSGLSQGTAPTAAGGGTTGLGALTLASTSSTATATIDFGSTQNGSALVFASLGASGKGAYVNLLHWTGVANGDNGSTTNDRLLFASDPGYTKADLAHWQFSNDAGTNFAVGGMEIAYNGYYEIVPVPEPATWLGGLALLGAAGWRLRCRVANRRTTSNWPGLDHGYTGDKAAGVAA